MEISINDISDIREAARQFLTFIQEKSQQRQCGIPHVFAFYGKMGAGKTTFIKALCEELGVDDTVTSPTFAIVNEYEVDEHARLTDDEYARIRPSRICHFDFYRIKRLEEVYDMGYEEYFYSDALCLVEWPELIEDLLPQDAVRVTIAVDEHGMRTVSVEDE